MLEPFSCENCIYGEYMQDYDNWVCSLDILDENECIDMYENDERM